MYWKIVIVFSQNIIDLYQVKLYLIEILCCYKLQKKGAV